MFPMPGRTVVRIGAGRLATGENRSNAPTQSPIHSSGDIKVFYALPYAPYGDPHAIMAAFTYSSLNTRWTFSHLPGAVSISQSGTTNEDPAQECWGASVPCESGGSRIYYGTSSTGSFLAPINYGASFSASASGSVETMGTRKRYFDENGKIVKITDRGAVHTYTRDGQNVTIEANTIRQPSRMRIVRSSGLITDVYVEVHHPDWGWVIVGEVDVGWGDDRIGSISVAPNGTTVHFTYHSSGEMATYEDCAGRACIITYVEEP